MVLAVSLSVGTRNTIVASLSPATTPGAVTVTCAQAAAAAHMPAIASPATRAPILPSRRNLLIRLAHLRSGASASTPSP
ncbi:MAG TPA: hypothetical protein VGJ59_13475 [Jatrophihabitantaceae bacterium]